MRFNILLFLTLVAKLFCRTTAYSNCDPVIVNKITEYWNGNIPHDLIGQAKANGKELVIEATAGYYPRDVQCVYSVFSNNTFTMTKVPKTGKPVTKSFEIHEDEGKTVSTTAGEVIFRYHVYQQNGVTGVYTCNDKGGDSDNVAAGFIKIRDGVNNEDAIREARGVLRDIGVDVKKGLCKKERKESDGSGSSPCEG